MPLDALVERLVDGRGETFGKTCGETCGETFKSAWARVRERGQPGPRVTRLAPSGAVLRTVLRCRETPTLVRACALARSSRSRQSRWTTPRCFDSTLSSQRSTAPRCWCRAVSSGSSMVLSRATSSQYWSGSQPARHKCRGAGSGQHGRRFLGWAPRRRSCRSSVRCHPSCSLTTTNLIMSVERLMTPAAATVQGGHGLWAA